MRRINLHPCIGDTCGRRDGVRCAEDACDIDLGIYTPRPGELDPDQEAYLARRRTEREIAPAPTETRP